VLVNDKKEKRRREEEEEGRKRGCLASLVVIRSGERMKNS
jgi:hypothetical protein